MLELIRRSDRLHLFTVSVSIFCAACVSDDVRQGALKKELLYRTQTHAFMPAFDFYVVQNDLESEWNRTQRSWKPEIFIFTIMCMWPSCDCSDPPVLIALVVKTRAECGQNTADPCVSANWHKLVGIMLLERKNP